MADSRTPSNVIKWEPYRPSNGTEGDIFMTAFCYRCRKDTTQSPCEIIARTMAYDELDPNYPKEWRRQVDDDSWPGTAECTAFEPGEVIDSAHPV